MNKRTTGCLLAAFIMLAGCVANPSKPGSANEGFVRSGFLADYSRLIPVEGLKGSYRFVDKSVNFHPYTKLMIDPVQVFIAHDADYKGMQPEMLKRITDAFRMEFVGAMLSGYQIVEQPGPDVLRVRLAITGINPVRPDRGVTDYIPVKAVFNAAREATGEAPRVAEIMGEFELLDSSGKVVAAAVSARKGSQSLAQSDRITWTDLQSIVAVWSKNFRQQLDLLRGR
jgi:hypothetical protein